MSLRFLARIVIISLCISGCTRTRPEPVDIKLTLDKSISDYQHAEQAFNAQPQVPLDVQAELMPSIGQDALDAQPQKKHLTINANAVPAATFFASLLQGSQYSSAIHPGVSGNITLSLQHATLAEALKLVADLYGFDIQKKGLTYHIYPAGMRVETIPLNYLMMSRVGKSRTTITSGRLTDEKNSSNSFSDSNLSSNEQYNDNNDNSTNNSNAGFSGTKIETVTDTDYWTELQDILTALIGTGGDRTILVSPQAGLVTVRAYPHEIRTVREYLQVAENHLQRQVVLEAKILEVNLKDDYQQGIDWSSARALNSTNILFDSSSQLADDIIQNTIGGGGALTIKNSNFKAVINLLDTQGDVNVLSSPRITASNNQKAVIKVGTDEYFVTDISNTTISGTSTVSNPSIELTPFFSGIALDVTPQISDNREVILHVHPSVIDVSEQRKQILISGGGEDGQGGIDIPLAKSDIRESDTIVKAASDDVIVIGGLMRSYHKELVSKTPFIGDIPWLGELFTNRQKVMKKTELVILIKPILVEQDTWGLELKRSRELLENWFPADEEEQEQEK